MLPYERRRNAGQSNWFKFKLTTVQIHQGSGQSPARNSRLMGAERILTLLPWQGGAAACTSHAFFGAAKTPRHRALREVREQPERRRRDIFVETQAHQPQSPIGAAYSEYIAPDGAWNLLSIGFYKDVAPTALPGERSKCV